MHKAHDHLEHPHPCEVLQYLGPDRGGNFLSYLQLGDPSTKMCDIRGRGISNSWMIGGPMDGYAVSRLVARKNILGSWT